MLPKALTEDICSLREGVERLAFSILWEFTPYCQNVGVRFTKSIIRYCFCLSVFIWCFLNPVRKLLSGKKSCYLSTSSEPVVLKK
jgi:hypothetical protein